MEIQNFEPLPSGAKQFSLSFAEEWKALKLKEAGDELWLGLVEGPFDPTYWERFFPGLSVHLLQMDANDFSSYLRRKHSHLGTPPAKRFPEEKADSAGDETILSPATLQTAAVNLVNGWIIEGIRKGASDIHIEIGRNNGMVRYRRDGVLQPGETLNRNELERVGNRIKVMAGMNVMESRLPQEGRFSINLGNETRDVRVSVLPSREGPSIVLRLLGSDGGPREIAQLGFSDKIASDLVRVLSGSQGLFLVTGPTGSGKTTTLNALLAALPRGEQKIISIEDPVEFRVEGITQVQVNPTIGLTFSSLLRRVLRQDPDVLMVGEIRDEETAQLAVRAAMTGHLVLSSLHTTDVNAVPRRLVNMGVPDYLTASVLKGALAQRLVRRLCPECSGASCSRCSETGFLGRAVMGELVMNDTMEGETREFERWYQRWCSAKRLRLKDAGLLMVQMGITSRDELKRIGV